MTAYDGWWEVPAHLFTKTQLADLDMPRVTTGPPIATVTTDGIRRCKETYELFDLTHTSPSKASAKQLAAAGRDFTSYICTLCSARAERPLGYSGLCPACSRITALQKRQAEMAEARLRHTAWAARLVADPAVLTVLTVPVLPPPAPSGRVGAPVAVTVTAANMALKTVVSMTVALVGTRSRHHDSSAVPAEQAWPKLRAKFAGARVLFWGEQYPERKLITKALADAEALPMSGMMFAWRATEWRGLVLPDRPSAMRPMIHPGRADRMALLLHRMAADHAQSETEAEAGAEAGT